MIKFFRKIRRQLLTENKFTKYLLYAIGEIVLVVIGILIALQINNNNEQKKAENKIIAILKEVQNDLELDIIKSDEILDYYYSRDSIIKLFQNNKLTSEDYVNNLRTRNLITSAKHIKIHNNGYNNLMENTDNIPDNLKAIINPLNQIYIYHKYEIDKFDKRMDVITDRYPDKLSSTKEWYHRYDNIPMDDDMLNYFLKDEFYKNDVHRYENAARVLRLEVLRFKINAINAYKQIAELTNGSEKLPDFIPQNLIEISQKELQAYVGVYKCVKENVNGVDRNISDGRKFNIAIDKNHLIIWNINSTRDNGAHLYFESENKTFDEDYRKFRTQFLKDATNNVSGMIFNNPVGTIKHYEKIE